MPQITIDRSAYSALVQDSCASDPPYLDDDLTIRNQDDTFTITLDTQLYNALMEAALEAPGVSLSEIVRTICAQTELNRLSRDGGTIQ